MRSSGQPRQVGALLALTFVAVTLAACSTRRPMYATALAGRSSEIPLPLSEGDSNLKIILTEGSGSRSRVVNDLAYLSDVIGPRLTGSAGLDRAHAWVQSKLGEYGADTVWSESYPFGRTWTRGAFALRLVAPYESTIQGASWGWAPGTDGPRTGDVALVSARTEAEFTTRYAGRLRGKWVMLFRPYPLTNPDGPTLTASDSAAQSAQADTITNVARTPEERRYQGGLRARLAGEGIAGILRESSKDYGLLNMSGSPSVLYPYSVIVLAHETYAQFTRLSERNVATRLEASIANSISADSVRQFNTFAEVRGREHPEEVVVVAAHLDSWDLGTGATDNGVGAAIVLEATRLIRLAGRPLRTVRFALFTGEEQGIIGSAAYVAAHPADMARVQAMLVLDHGTGRITGVALQGRDDLRDLWLSLFAPLSNLGPFHVRSGEKSGSDHLPFVAAGVPAFNPDQEERGYDHTHHSQIDTFDHVVPADVRQAATVMAALAYELADMPLRVSRVKSAASNP